MVRNTTCASRTPEMSRESTAVRVGPWVRLALAPLLLLAVLWTVDLRAVGQQLAQASPGWLLAGLACSVLSNLASAWRWCALVRWLGHGLAWMRAQQLYFQAMAISALLPGAVVGGDVFRAVALRRSGQGALEAGLSVLLDRLSGLWMLWVLATLAAAWGLARGEGAALAAFGLAQALPLVLLALGMVFALAPALVFQCGHWLLRAAPQASWRQRLATLLGRPGARAQYLWQLLASTMVQTLSVAALACTGRAVGIELPYWAYAVAAAPTFLMAALPVSFGGWGTREAAAVLSLAAFGVAAPAAAAASVLYGLLGLAQGLAGALLSLAMRRSSSHA